MPSHKNILLQVTGQETNLVGKKAFLKGSEICLCINFGQFPCFWILIRIPDTDPDPEDQNQYESSSGSWTDFAVNKVEFFYKKNILYAGNRS
jgi:hypothetical protein